MSTDYISSIPSMSTTEEPQKVRMVSFGGVKISMNAYMIVIAGIILSVTLAFLVPQVGPLVGLFVLFLFMVLSYNVNCVLLGHCHIWAWFLTITYLIYTGVVVYSVVMHKDSLSTMVKKYKKTK